MPENSTDSFLTISSALNLIAKFFLGLPVMQDTLDAAQADAESVVVDRLSSLLSTLDLAVNFWTIAAMADFNCFFHVFFVLYGQHVCVIQKISTKPRKEG